MSEYGVLTLGAFVGFHCVLEALCELGVLPHSHSGDVKMTSPEIMNISFVDVVIWEKQKLRQQLKMIWKIWKKHAKGNDR